MKEKTLMKTALLCLVIGLGILYLLSENLEIEKKDINKIDGGDIDSEVKVSGVVSKIIETNKVTILEVTQQTKTNVIVFKGNLSVAEGEKVEVYGKVDEYEGRYEIIGDIIRRKKG